MQIEQERRPIEPVLLKIHPGVTRLTSLGRTTIYNEIAAGRLRAVRIGRAVRVRRDDLDRWLERRTGGGSDEGDAAA